MAIDYGEKRTGLAVTDILKIAAHPLETVKTRELQDYLKEYVRKEEVETFVIGWPTHADGHDLPVGKKIRKFAEWVRNQFPDTPVHFQDENYSSSRAREILIQTGVGKKKRREKERVDKIAAVLILQEFLGHI